MRKILVATLLAALLFSFTFTSISAVAAQENEYLQVGWNELNYKENYTRAWNQTNLVFGPLPKIQISTSGATLPTDGTGIIPLDEPVNITIIIPKKAVLSGEVGFATVSFSGWLSDLSALLTLSYNWQTDFSSSYYKYASPTYQGEFDPSPFFELNLTESKVETTDENFYVTFIGVFNSSTIPGRYQINYRVYDTNNIGFTSGEYSALRGNNLYDTYIIGNAAEIDIQITTPTGELIPERMVRWNEEVWIHVSSDVNLEKVELNIDVHHSITVDGQVYQIYIYLIYNSSGVYMREGYAYWIFEPNNSHLRKVFLDNYTYFLPTGNDTSNPQDIIFKVIFTENLTANRYELKYNIKPEGNTFPFTPSDFDPYIYVESFKISLTFTDEYENPLWGIAYEEPLYLAFSVTGPDEKIQNITAFTIEFGYTKWDQTYQTTNMSRIFLTYSFENDSFDTLGEYEVRNSTWQQIEYYTFDPFTDLSVVGIDESTGGNITKLDTTLIIVFSSNVPARPYWFTLSIYDTPNPIFRVPPHSPFDWITFNDYKPLKYDFVIGVTIVTPPPETLAPYRITEDGALDLDGNFETVEDQYYVLSQYYSLDGWVYNSTGMQVVIDWMVGNTTISSIRFQVGLATYTNEYNWFTNHYWYHSDWSPVSNSEMLNIQNLVNSTFGYELLKYTVRNTSLADFIGSSWWLDDNKWSYSWFYFTIDESYIYQTAAINDTAQFHSDYSALLLFNDSDGDGIPKLGYQSDKLDTGEVTHFYLIDNVEQFVFQHPFNSNQPFGSLSVPLNTSIDFTVTLNNVTGTLYPAKLAEGTLYSPYMFYHTWDLPVNMSDFDKSVEQAAISQMQFAGHFQVTTEDNVSSALLKVDQRIGDWNLTHFDNSILQGRSLAITYNAYLTTTSTQTQFTAGETPLNDPNTNSTASDTYQFESQQARLAEIRMGGLNYTWGKDNANYTAPASTTPLYTFESMYTTPTGDYLTTFTIQSSMFFLTTGFKNWDGYSIYNDPVFSIFPVFEAGAGGSEAVFQWTLITVSVVVIALISVTLVILRKRRGLR